MTDTPTRDKILNTAEKLFATQGFSATSLRAIIKEAGVNTAAAHYHFGSKEGVIEAVMLRRAEPVNEERLRLLAGLEKAHPTGALPLEDVAAAFLGPAIQTVRHPDHKHILPKLMARAISEPGDELMAVKRKIFGEIYWRFTAAFRRALPGLSEEDVHWRMHCMMGAMVFTVIVPMVEPEQDMKPPESADRIVERLVDFVAAGMRAPVPVRMEDDKR